MAEMKSPFLFIRSYDMPLIGFCDGGDFVAILSYKSGTTMNYGVNRNIKW